MKIMIIAGGESDFAQGLSSPQEEAFAKLCSENRKRAYSLAEGFSALGEKTLFVFPKPLAAPEGKFEISGEGNLRLLSVETGKSKAGIRLPLKEYFDFGALLREKAPELIKLFSPDAIIYSALFPFAVSGAEKLASLSGAVLITELPCSSSKITERLRFPFFESLLLPVLKKGLGSAIEKSALLVSYYPLAAEEFPENPKLLQLDFPFSKPEKEPSEAAKELFGELSELRGKGPLLIYGGTLSEGKNLDWLLSVFVKLGGKYRLVLVGDGSYKPVLKRTARENNAENIFFFDAVPEKELAYLFGAGSAAFVSESETLRGVAPFSGEVFAALASGKPVFARAGDFSGVAGITRVSEADELRKELDLLPQQSTEKLQSEEKKRKKLAESKETAEYLQAYHEKIKSLLKKEKKQ